MDIVEVSRRSGLPASAIRYYEEQGLIRSTGRRGLRRLFGDDVLERLALVALGQAGGLSLREIGQMFRAGGRVRVDRDLLARKADELDARIRRMTAMRDGLRHAARCPAPDHLECPTFRRLMGLAGKGRAGGKRRDVAT